MAGNSTAISASVCQDDIESLIHQVVELNKKVLAAANCLPDNIEDDNNTTNEAQKKLLLSELIKNMKKSEDIGDALVTQETVSRLDERISNLLKVKKILKQSTLQRIINYESKELNTLKTAVANNLTNAENQDSAAYTMNNLREVKTLIREYRQCLHEILEEEEIKNLGPDFKMILNKLSKGGTVDLSKENLSEEALMMLKILKIIDVKDINNPKEFYLTNNYTSKSQ